MKRRLDAAPWALWLVCLATSLAGGCSRPHTAVAVAAAPGGDAVLAEVDGKRITQGQVDEKARGQLSIVRQTEYEARKHALDDLVAGMLTEREAAARGITTEALLKLEVDGKTPTPTAAELAAIYRDHAASFGDRTLEQVAPDLSRAIRERDLASRREAFLQELRRKAKVKVLLEPPRFPVEVPASAPSLGPAGAKVTVVEFLDYQCPYCRRASTTVEALLKRYDGKIRFVHRDFPIDGHPGAMPAARGVHCAGQQGRFWEFHRGLFETPGDLSAKDLTARAAALGLNPQSFAACVASDRFDADIRSSFDAGSQLGVNSTPTFFVNGRMLIGARTEDSFAEIIDAELAAGG